MYIASETHTHNFSFVPISPPLVNSLVERQVLTAYADRVSSRLEFVISRSNIPDPMRTASAVNNAPTDMILEEYPRVGKGPQLLFEVANVMTTPSNSGIVVAANPRAALKRKRLYESWSHDDIKQLVKCYESKSGPSDPCSRNPVDLGSEHLSLCTDRLIHIELSRVAGTVLDARCDALSDLYCGRLADSNLLSRLDFHAHAASSHRIALNPKRHKPLIDLHPLCDAVERCLVTRDLIERVLVKHPKKNQLQLLLKNIFVRYRGTGSYSVGRIVDVQVRDEQTSQRKYIFAYDTGEVFSAKSLSRKPHESRADLRSDTLQWFKTVGMEDPARAGEFLQSGLQAKRTLLLQFPVAHQLFQPSFPILTRSDEPLNANAPPDNGDGAAANHQNGEGESGGGAQVVETPAAPLQIEAGPVPDPPLLSTVEQTPAVQSQEALVEMVLKAMAQLSPPNRQVVHSRFFQTMSPQVGLEVVLQGLAGHRVVDVLYDYIVHAAEPNDLVPEAGLESFDNRMREVLKTRLLEPSAVHLVSTNPPQNHTKQ
eukprot:c9749_g1_i1.p1 GENE.c9749_g1_i1~~c9749_g1_i1.p1  ORF type:complete len:540 (+),score=102.22 c9749_g1_i1:572-2191(+)